MLAGIGSPRQRLPKDSAPYALRIYHEILLESPTRNRPSRLFINLLVPHHYLLLMLAPNNVVAIDLWKDLFRFL